MKITTTYEKYIDSDGNTVEVETKSLVLFGVTIQSTTAKTVYLTSQTITL